MRIGGWMGDEEDVRQIEGLVVDTSQTLEGVRVCLSLLWVELQCPSRLDNRALRQVVWATMDSLRSCVGKLGMASELIEEQIRDSL